MHIKFILGLALSSVLLPAATIILSDGTFPDANWSQVAVVQDPGTVTTGVNGQVASGGNPSFYRQQNLGTGVLAAGASAAISIANFHSSLTYNPSASGAILGLLYDYDLARFSATSSGGGYRPVIRQNGSIFQYTGATDVAANTAWTHFSHTITSSEWLALAGFGSGLPDFSASGGLIEFGYRDGAQFVCTLPSGNCAPLNLTSGIDNFQATLTTADASGGVPEPSTLGMAGAGLTALAFLRRRNHRSR